MDGNQVPQELVTKVGEAFESILKEASCLLTFLLMFFPLFFAQLHCDQRQKFLKHCFLLGRWTCFQQLGLKFYSVSPVFELVFVSLMQTEKVRQEISEDMSILRAFSIVSERRPDLRFNEMNCTKMFY